VKKLDCDGKSPYDVAKNGSKARNEEIKAILRACK
jgi:hypothetical protein